MTKAIIKLNNYSNYEIYPKDGKIWSLKNNKFIGSNNKGYLNCTLFDDNGVRWNSKIHRVVYTACYGEIPEGMEVNHIDEDKTNNSIFNLNLMTPKENYNWGTRNERIRTSQINHITKSKPVGAYKDGKLVIIFQSIKEANRNGFKDSNISKCCNGKRKSHKGYQWKFIDEKVD